ncbi:MAG TPA: lipase family protein, partial [Vicinamibacteria bacterium]
SLRSATWIVLLALLPAACRGGAGTSSSAPKLSPATATPAPPAVDLDEVLAYARRASAAYGDEAAIRAAIGPGPALTVANLHGVDVRAFIEVDEAKRVQWLAVRGTANLENAAEDADYTKVPAPELGIPVHTGFAADARAVWSFARPLLRPGLETRVTGHSLGGAVAVLLAMRLRVDGVPLGHVITFGQPKVTTEVGVARFRDLPLLRVVNHDDPVPLLPWETPGAVVGGLYRHLGRELRLSNRGTFELFAEHSAERYLLTSFVARLGREHPEEHEIARYLGRIETLIGTRPAPVGPS